MNNFQSLIEDILSNYKSKMKYTAVAADRQRVLSDMKAELLICKQTWDALHPEGGANPDFSQIMGK